MASWCFFRVFWNFSNVNPSRDSAHCCFVDANSSNTRRHSASWVGAGSGAESRGADGTPGRGGGAGNGFFGEGEPPKSSWPGAEVTISSSWLLRAAARGLLGALGGFGFG